MIQYDEKIIQQHAERLYLQADNVIRSHTLIAALLGVVIGLAYAVNPKTGHSEPALMWFAAIFMGAIGAALGRSIAKPKALQYKMQAQAALCQCQIEKNTRPAAQQSAEPHLSINASR